VRVQAAQPLLLVLLLQAVVVQVGWVVQVLVRCLPASAAS
jgi:hypothetical protein